MNLLPLFNTYIHPSASDQVSRLLNTTFISEGDVVKQFESRLEADLGLRHCVTVNSGTSALHLALVLAGVTKGDEVILPAQTFIATGLVILQQNAIPVFADIDYDTGNISIESIKSKITEKTKAIIPVHWGGYPCNMDEIQALAKAHNLVVIEDAAHALGASYKSKAIGTLSDYTCFSFQAIKHLTTGDGGAVCSLQDAAYTEAITLRWFGINRDHSPQTELGERNYNVKEVGYKYHLNNYGAALGLANLEGFAERLERRINTATYYQAELAGVPGIRLFRYESDRRSAYWLFGFHVEKRLDFVRRLREKGITASVVHQRIDRNSVFGGIKNDLVNQARFDDTQIHIPIHDAITPEQAVYITDTIKAGW